MRLTPIRSLAAGAIAALAFAAIVAVSAPAAAQELKIAVAADVTSIDPHFYNLFPNNNIAEHIFDKLVQMDADSKMIPGLATSWKTIDDDDLGIQAAQGREVPRRQRAHGRRRHVHDRPRADRAEQPRARSPPYTKAIQQVEIVDPYTIRFKYGGAVSAVAQRPVDDLHRVEEGRDRRVDRRLQLGQGGDRQRAATSSCATSTAIASSSRATTTTGARSRAGEKVTFRIIKNEAARVAALLSGDVDAIEQPPTADLARAQGRPQVHASRRRSRTA